MLGDLYDIYYDNRDLRLLLELLATSSGVAPAIAIMTLFDKVRGKTLCKGTVTLESFVYRISVKP